MEDKMHINFLLLRVAICLLLLPPLEAFAGDCRVGYLTVRVHQKQEGPIKGPDIIIGELSFSEDGEGYVLFNVGKDGKLNILSKNLSGHGSSTSSVERGCSHFESHSNSILTEGNMGRYGGIHTAYWKSHTKGQETLKGGPGCMEGNPPPINYTDESEDFRFEGIVHPSEYKLSSLCSKVKNNPQLGYCNESPLGYYGLMIQKTHAQPGVESEVGNLTLFEYEEVYEWYLKKVPCGRGSPRPPSPVNRCLDNYENCKQDADKKLIACYSECEKKSFQPDGDLIYVHSCKSMTCNLEYEQEMRLCKSEVSACVESASRE